MTALGRSGFLQKGGVRFLSRNRRDLTERFAELQQISKSIKAATAIIDGEIVALDESGLHCFNDLRYRNRDGRCVIVFYAFDLLYLDGNDLTQCAKNRLEADLT